MSFDVAGGIYRPSGKVSLTVTSIFPSHLMFYINCTRAYSSIWFIGVRTFLLLRNWIVESEYFYQHLVFDNLKMEYLLYAKYQDQNGRTWQRSYLAASLAACL